MRNPLCHSMLGRMAIFDHCTVRFMAGEQARKEQETLTISPRPLHKLWFNPFDPFRLYFSYALITLRIALAICSISDSV